MQVIKLSKRVLTPLSAILYASMILLPQASAQIVTLDLQKKMKAKDILVKNYDGTDPIDLGNEPPLNLGDKDFAVQHIGDGDKAVLLVFKEAPGALHDAKHGHTHDAIKGANTACHRYVLQNGVWYLVHICP